MSILLRQTGLALPMATMTPNILTGTLIEHGRSCICSMPVTWVDISNFHPSRLQTWRKQLLALWFGWPLTFLARHHAGPFINLVRQNPVLQNPVLQIQRPRCAHFKGELRRNGWRYTKTMCEPELLRLSRVSWCVAQIVYFSTDNLFMHKHEKWEQATLLAPTRKSEGAIAFCPPRFRVLCERLLCP